MRTLVSLLFYSNCNKIPSPSEERSPSQKGRTRRDREGRETGKGEVENERGEEEVGSGEGRRVV